MTSQRISGRREAAGGPGAVGRVKGSAGPAGPVHYEPHLDRQHVAAATASYLVDVLDFPSPGIVFKDLTPLFAAPAAFGQVIDWIADIGREHGVVDGIGALVGIESRGFLLGAPAALALAVPFVPVRKAGKLPRAVLEQSYDLEYGSATLAIHADAFPRGTPVLVVDDVLATGGTAAAAGLLIDAAGGAVVAYALLLELVALGGRAALGSVPVETLLAG